MPRFLLSLALAVAGLCLFSFPYLYSRIAGFACIAAAGVVLERRGRKHQSEAPQSGPGRRVALLLIAFAGIALVASLVSSEDRRRVVRQAVSHLLRNIVR